MHKFDLSFSFFFIFLCCNISYAIVEKDCMYQKKEEVEQGEEEEGSHPMLILNLYFFTNLLVHYDLLVGKMFLFLEYQVIGYDLNCFFIDVYD